jgi:hypothetical protein
MRVVSLVLVSAILLGGIPARAAETSDFVGKWSGVGEGEVDAAIRRGKAKPDWIIIDLEVGAPGCGGSVTVHGRVNADGKVQAQSDKDPAADPQMCTIELEMVGRKALRVSEGAGCSYHHGASCGFSSNLTKKR